MTLTQQTNSNNSFLGHIVRFLILIIGILGLLFLVRWTLYIYAHQQPLSVFQTPLLQQITRGTRPLTGYLSNSSTAPPSFINLKLIKQKDHWLITDLQGNAYRPSSSPASLFFLVWPEIKGPQDNASLRTWVKLQEWLPQSIFCSRADGVLKDLRALEPHWNFCNGEIFVAKMLNLQALGLEALLKIKSDLFFIHLTNIPYSSRIEKLVQEGHRQNKIVILGPLNNPPKETAADGWLLKN